MTGSLDQLRTSSAMKVSRHESLVESRFAERRERLRNVLTPASFAACANGHMNKAGLDRPDQGGRFDTFRRRHADGVDL
jgi:hypothetical protein